MSEIILVDTSIFLNILDIPNMNQQKQLVLDDLSRKIADDHKMLLPLATIWETGNHISKLNTGGLRRRFGEKFVAEVNRAIEGTAPFVPTSFHSRQGFLELLERFPDFTMRNKNDQRPNEGGSLADLSILKEWEELTKKSPRRIIAIWSLDQDLTAYRYVPNFYT